MKTDANCVFCKVVAGQMPCFKLLEDDGTLAIMDIYPANERALSRSVERALSHRL